jgi:hypothetical protein
VRYRRGRERDQAKANFKNGLLEITARAIGPDDAGPALEQFAGRHAEGDAGRTARSPNPKGSRR